ncbi:MAG: hypothetical protein NVSMB45_05320 [Ginsengibacter sp.]
MPMSSILFLSLTGERNWSKSEELWSSSAQYLKQHGEDVTCLLYEPYKKNVQINDLLESQCKLIYLPNKGFRKKNLVDRVTYHFSKRKLKKLFTSFDFGVFDHVVVNVNSLNLNNPAYADCFSKLKSYSVIFQLSYTEEYVRPNDIKVLRNVIMNAEVNLFLSEHIKTSIENKLSMLIENSAIFINPLRVSTLNAFPNFVKQSHYIFTMYAPLNISINGQDKLIKIFETPKWRQRNFILNIYGTGRDAEELQNLLDRKYLNNKIFLKGVPEDFEDVLKKTHLFFQITNEEQIHCPIKDAVAMGRPLIVSTKGNCGKWIKNRINGFTVNRCSMDEIEAVMEMAWKERNNWEEMGRKSFELFNERFPKSIERKLLIQMGLIKDVKKNILKLAKTG